MRLEVICATCDCDMVCKQHMIKITFLLTESFIRVDLAGIPFGRYDRSIS